MSSSLVRSTYRRMMKYFLRHWCMEIKCDGNRTAGRSTKKNGQDACQKSTGYEKQRSNNENETFQTATATATTTTKDHLDKAMHTDDGIVSDAQLEWEHEEGIEHSPKIYRKSEQDLLDILLTQSSPSKPSPATIRSPYYSDFEWDHLFDFTL